MEELTLRYVLDVTSLRYVFLLMLRRDVIVVVALLQRAVPLELVEKEFVHVHVRWIHIVETNRVRTQHSVSLQIKERFARWIYSVSLKIK